MVGDYVNNKGFAITTMVYALVILLSMSMFLVLNIMDNNYNDNKKLVNEVQEELDECLKNGC
jgi:hypothetical protein